MVCLVVGALLQHLLPAVVLAIKAAASVAT
ncbi:hypothetical protein HaLaN_02485 [Haematococcus lacustris]|uniref:Uncharacterized protein n=1 Tax=Haematococcus lacustris TaxID=44745 RepID=A0A699YLB6_HAELA|nr:hypothetical protein HaLaN_02485 [Haematococcus lacustris]